MLTGGCEKEAPVAGGVAAGACLGRWPRVVGLWAPAAAVQVRSSIGLGVSARPGQLFFVTAASENTAHKRSRASCAGGQGLTPGLGSPRLRDRLGRERGFQDGSAKRAPRSRSDLVFDFISQQSYSSSSYRNSLGKKEGLREYLNKVISDPCFG